MEKEEIEQAEIAILKALAEKKHGNNVLIQHWQDGWLIHTYNEYGNHLHTFGAANLYEVINKLGSCH